MIDKSYYWIENCIINSLYDEFGEQNEMINSYNKKGDVEIENDIKIYEKNIKGPVYFEIKINDRFNRYNYEEDVIYVTFNEKDDLDKKILGLPFIKKYLLKHQKHWWHCASMLENLGGIELKDSNTAIYKCSNKFLSKLDITIDSLNKDKLSDINIERFKKDFKNNGNNLSLFVGNGVSIPFGSDKWHDMTNYLLDYMTPFYIDNKTKIYNHFSNSNYLITSFVKENLGDKYWEAVYNSIYRKYDYNLMHKNNTLIHKIVEAKYNNNSIKIFTYNFDVFIENDFKKYHPKLLISSCDLKKQVINYGNEIVHIHGFIDYGILNKKSNIILTDEDYFKNYNQKRKIYTMQRNIIKDDLCLFVGSSLTDVFQQMIMNDASNLFEMENNEIWHCFALICFKDLSFKEILLLYNFYVSRSILVIFVNDYEDLPSKFEELMK